MDFSLTQDQRMMQESLARTLAQAAPLDRVRLYAGDLTDTGADLWAALADFGLAGLVIPERYGGLGLGLLDAALAAEMLGRAAAPVPFLGAILAPLALQLAGSAAQQDLWLPKLASGEVTAAVAISEAVAGARDGAGVTAVGGRLTGKALFVEGGLAAQLLVVADTTGALHLVTGDAAGLTRQLITGIDQTRRLAELTFEAVPAEPLDAAPGTLSRLRDAGWVLLAADSLGACDQMLAQAVAYAKERRQFGRTSAAVLHRTIDGTAGRQPTHYRQLSGHLSSTAEVRRQESTEDRQRPEDRGSRRQAHE